MRLTRRIEDEMTRLVEPEIPALRRYARLLVREAAGADDLVQDCLERALGRWRTRSPEKSVRPWLFAILHNLAVDQIRAMRRRGAHVPLDAMEESVAAERPMQDDMLSHRDLLRAVERLPDEQRSTLVLVAIEGLSYAETAAATGVPIGTVMSRLHRARERLAQELNQETPGSPPPSLRIVR